MSSHKAKALVLDAWSVIAYLEDEPSAEAVEELVAAAHDEGLAISMTVINVGEVWYTLAREVSETEADSSITELRHLGIEFVDADWELVQEAARFKAKHKMSFADCFAAALAKRDNAELVTGDREFKPVEGRIRIHWV